MKKIQAVSYRRQNPMLAEMVIILLFFSICACILTGVFAAAFSQSEQAASLNDALVCSEEILESFKVSTDSPAVFLEGLGFSRDASAWSCKKRFSKTVYLFSAATTETNNTEGFVLTVSSGKEDCFSLPIVRYCGEVN